MNQEEFNSLIDSLVEAVKDYKLYFVVDLYDAVYEKVTRCEYTFKPSKAWELVTFARTLEDHAHSINGMDRIFKDAEEFILERNEANREEIEQALDGIMMDYAYEILKIATIQRYQEKHNYEND